MLSPIDIVVAVVQFNRERSEWTFAALGEQLGVSSSVVHRAVKSITEAGLFDPGQERIKAHALHEFLVHGLKYLCPAEIGRRTRGIPTGPFVAPLASAFGLSGSSPDAWVWPHGDGSASGAAFEPLHQCVPALALADPSIHERFAVVDALRAGRARERRAAEEWLRRELRIEAT